MLTSHYHRSGWKASIVKDEITQLFANLQDLVTAMRITMKTCKRNSILSKDQI